VKAVHQVQPLMAEKCSRFALDNYASSMILAHTHPSGNIKPSDRDQVMTKRIIETGKLLDIKVIDHLIVGNPGYFSFADEGMMGDTKVLFKDYKQVSII